MIFDDHIVRSILLGRCPSDVLLLIGHLDTLNNVKVSYPTFVLETWNHKKKGIINALYHQGNRGPSPALLLCTGMSTNLPPRVTRVTFLSPHPPSRCLPSNVKILDTKLTMIGLQIFSLWKNAWSRLFTHSAWNFQKVVKAMIGGMLFHSLLDKKINGMGEWQGRT